MHYRYRFVIFVFLFAWPVITISQQRKADASDEPIIKSAWQQLQFTGTTRSVKMPKRKFDSPFFCDELMQYKNGFIINSITTNRNGRSVSVHTSFYYINLKTKMLSQLAIPGVDTIESILANSANELYCSYKKSGGRVIELFRNNENKDISLSATAEIKTQLDSAEWLKLGYSNGELYAMSPATLFVYGQNKWRKLCDFEFPGNSNEFSKARRRLFTLPTENITVAGDYVYFLQEIVQERRADLIQLDIKTGTLSDFFISQGLTDNYLKQVNDYVVLPDQTILVAASRLLGNQLLMAAAPAKADVWIFNNQLKNSAVSETIPVTSLLREENLMILAGPAGIYKKVDNHLECLLKLINATQMIKAEDGRYEFEFFPRSLARIDSNRLLVGGMWGGLYLVDLAAYTVECLDDKKESLVKILNLSSLSSSN
jgi:hypothetical protein